MNREIAELWVKDLRTNPPQAQERLFNGRGHCCLGRLCELFPGIVKTKREDAEGKTVFLFDGGKFLLPKTVQQWAGMKSSEGRYNSVSLSSDNDNGKSFAEIADIIEAHVDEL